MTVQETIESKLRSALQPHHLEVINESGGHNVAPGSETHFRVLVVSSAFEGKPALQRHRMVYQLLEPERQGGVHALGIQTLTPDEFGAHASISSPPCLGGDGTAPGRGPAK